MSRVRSPLIHHQQGTLTMDGRFLKSNKNVHFSNLMNAIIRFLLTGVAVVIASYLLPGVHTDDYGSALLVALVLSIVNLFVKPILVIFTIPLTFFTLGLFLLVINALMIMLTDWLTPGFRVDGFWWALAFSLILSILNSMFSDLTKEKEKD